MQSIRGRFIFTDRLASDIEFTHFLSVEANAARKSADEVIQKMKKGKIAASVLKLELPSPPFQLPRQKTR